MLVTLHSQREGYLLPLHVRSTLHLVSEYIGRGRESVLEVVCTEKGLGWASVLMGSVLRDWAGRESVLGYLY